jgi:hypothetical protein
MAQQLTTRTALIEKCIDRLQAGYRHIFGLQDQHCLALVEEIAEITLRAIAQGDAAYHNLEHTVLVTFVGQELLRGKHHLEGNVSPEDWLHFIVSLLCHDIGYIRGICQQDDLTQHLFASGARGETAHLAPTATDASLAPFHVDRGKLFIEEQFGNHPFLDGERLKLNIELTRFPIPDDDLYHQTHTYQGLARVADLVGQLSDPRYLDKLPALFSEMVETNAHKAFGCVTSKDLRAKYPFFYRTIVCPCIENELRYLSVTHQGVQMLMRLYLNLAIVETEQLFVAA